MATFDAGGLKNLSGAAGVFLALLLAVTHNASLAQTPAAEPADTRSAATEYQTYNTTGTTRADKGKPADVIAQEQADFDRNEAACAQGDQSACTQLGAAYEYGRGSLQVRPIAGILYSEACQSGLADGCYRLGQLNQVVFEIDKRPLATLDFERACNLGSMDGCLKLAMARWDGEGIERDMSEAERLFRLSCDRGANGACRELAKFLMDTYDSEVATGEAVGLFIKQCEAGDARACGNLDSLSGSQEPPAGLPHPARVLYLGCLAGDPAHCERLGNRAMLGEGIASDKAYALAMYDRACSLDANFCEAGANTRDLPILTERCNQGDFAACANVGTIYLGGNTVFSNDQSAFNFLSYACENGEIDACQPAGVTANSLYYSGASQLWGRAQPLFEIGCSQANKGACRVLADSLRLGETMPQDKPRAYELYGRLCEQDERSACEFLERASVQESEIPFALAGADFDPPRTEEEEEEFRRQLIADQAAQCDTNSAEFRGRIYSDKLCNSSNYVLNGYRLQPGQAPWQALLWRPERVRGVPRPLQAHERVLCGGAIIRRGWILTAAHCLKDQGGSIAGRGYRIRLGVHNPREDEGFSYPILSVHKHDRYRPEIYKFGFDIGLIRYDASRGEQLGATNSRRRIALDDVPVSQRAIPRRMPAYVYGWGLTAARSGTTTDALRGARLRVFPLDECTDSTNYRGAYLNSALCAAGDNGEQACTGDSGGPLIYYGDADGKPRVIGVVSSGFRCGTTGKASRYTRVAAARDWIDRVISGR